MLKISLKNERTVSFDVVEIVTMWLSTSPNSAKCVAKSVNLAADSKQVREFSNVDTRFQKRQSVGFYAQNYLFLLV